MTVVSALNEMIKYKIINNGPIPISEFMTDVLSSEMFSYYKARSPIGIDGDFITAPEISQLFGEIIGIWCANYWIISEKPKRIKLIELGPGKGTLMSDILRSTVHIKDFHKALEIELVEINEKLINEQQKNIHHHSINWHKKYSDIDNDVLTIIIANEFFDALPIDQYIKREKLWHINKVDLDKKSNHLCFTKDSANKNMRQYLENKYQNVLDGGIVEINDVTTSIVKEITKDIKKNGGAMLIIDYGYQEIPGREYISTLQSVKNHQFNGVFDNIGEADITAHVNFSAIAETVNLFEGYCYEIISQRQFLQNMQIETLKERLLLKATKEQKKHIISGYHRLIDKDQMGELFKVAVVSDKRKKDFIGF